MEQRKLGTGGLSCGAVAFGCMGINHNRGQALTQQEADALLRGAYDLGITMFDTAEWYGPYTNEEMVGQALKPIRDKVVIATKFGIYQRDGQRVTDSRPETIRAAVEGSLKRLRTDYIDLYYQHRVDPDTPMEVVAETVKELVKEGKVKHWGLSEPSLENIRKAHAVLPLAAVESEYSIMWREPEVELLPLLEELNIGLVPFSPLGKGFLTGKIGTKPQFSSADSRLKVPYLQPENLEKNQVILDTLQACAQAHDATVTQIALAWLLAQKPFIVPIPGSKKIGRVRENAGAADVKLTAQELQALTQALNAIPVAGYRFAADSVDAKEVGK